MDAPSHSLVLVNSLQLFFAQWPSQSWEKSKIQFLKEAFIIIASCAQGYLPIYSALEHCAVRLRSILMADLGNQQIRDSLNSLKVFDNINLNGVRAANILWLYISRRGIKKASIVALLLFQLLFNRFTQSHQWKEVMLAVKEQDTVAGPHSDVTAAAAWQLDSKPSFDSSWRSATLHSGTTSLSCARSKTRVIKSLSLQPYSHLLNWKKKNAACKTHPLKSMPQCLL